MTDQNQHIQDDQLQAYLDGVLETTSTGEIKAHLAACPLCHEKLSRLETLEARLESLPEVRFSKDLSGLVVSQLKDERSLSPVITWTLVLEALAAGTVIGALIPAFQAAGWLPRLVDVRLAVGAAINIFLAQLASSWIVWWAGLKVQFNQLIGSFNPLEGLAIDALSPWVLIGVAGGLAILMNTLLLGRHPQTNGNHNKANI